MFLAIINFHIMLIMDKFTLIILKLIISNQAKSELIELLNVNFLCYTLTRQIHMRVWRSSKKLL